MKKLSKIFAVALVALLFAGLLAACGDATATTAPAATTARATTAAATTAAVAATTAASAATTAASAATTAAGAATTAAGAATTAASAATTAAGAAPAGATSGTIKIYSSLPRTGSSKGQTDTIVNAIKLAIEDFTGGTKKVGNFTIEYVDLDDATAAKGQWDADQEKANANRAVNDPDAMIYLGTFNSGAAKVAIPILNPASLAMISPSNTAVGLTKNVPGLVDQGEPDTYYPNKTRNYFRVVGADDLQGPAGAEFIKTLNAKKVFVIDDSQAYGVGLARAFVAYCKTISIECSNPVSITGKESNYNDLATQIQQRNPDAIYFGGITQQQAGKLIGDIRAAGIKAPFVGGDGIQEQAFIDDAKTAAEGAYATVAGVTEDKLGEKGKAFLKNYRAKFGPEEPYAIYGYEIASVALNAIKTAGVKDRKAILSALANTKGYEGVLGKWNFNANGDIDLVDFVMYQVKDRKWVPVTSIRPKTAGQ